MLARFITVPFTFILIKNQSDAPLLLAISGFTEIVSGALSIFWIKKNLHFRGKAPTIPEVSAEFKGGSSVFLSTVWISCYSTITPIILGSIAGVTAVGYYAFADRFKGLAQSVLNPVSQALYPRLSHLFEKRKKEERLS